MKVLEVKGVNKYFGSNHVLKDVSFSMEKGEVLAIIGSSGGGKTTLLRSLTFLERIQKGTIEIGGESIITDIEKEKKPSKYIWKEIESKKSKNNKDDNAVELEVDLSSTNKKTCAICNKLNSIKNHKFKKLVKIEDKEPTTVTLSSYPKDKELREKRLKMGLVFQEFNLFPHKTVVQNLMMAPMLVKKSMSDDSGINVVKVAITEEQAREKALEVLEQVGLSDKADAYPCEISGGQKQRVAIARALCMNPEILCFDEPTSALDPELTGEVLKVISSLKDTGVTMLIVTHEIMFAREIADTVIFLDGGRILEMGDAKTVIDNPTEERTKEFMNKILKG